MDKDIVTLADLVNIEGMAWFKTGKHNGIPFSDKDLDEIVKNFDLSQPFNLDVRSLICDGNTAVVQQRLTATAKATGNLYDNQYCWIYTCDDGHITHMEEYADTVVAAKAMGWGD